MIPLGETLIETKPIRRGQHILDCPKILLVAVGLLSLLGIIYGVFD